MQSNAASDAAQTQADSANYAASLQNQQWQQTQKNLKPYMDLGSSAINPLLSAMGYNVTKSDDGTYSFNGTNPTNILQQQFSAPTAAQAAATPGYQFTLNQGLKSVQNSAAARGLGTSGAALKGASTYATGLADSTYNDVFNRALQTFNTNYSSAANNVNRLSGLVGNGQNAAATNGSLGAAAAGNIGNTLMSGANAQASGMVGSANALAGGMNSVANGAMTYGLLSNNALSNATSVNPSYGAVSASNPTGYNVGSNSYGFSV
ncbi:hypothetical protein DIE15_12225 [Burkholderia sp. Bp9031]|nr:hypothetical protein DIE15_12225 [Burkholderia sp. Bp9031]